MNMNATLLGQAIAFILFVWFCMKFVWPPIITAIENRQKEITEGLQAAELAKKELESAKVYADEVLSAAKKEANVIIEQANKRKAQILKEARLQATSEKETTMARGRVELEIEYERAKNELRKQVGALVIAGAEKIIERSIDKSVNSDIIDKLAKQL